MCKQILLWKESFGERKIKMWQIISRLQLLDDSSGKIGTLGDDGGVYSFLFEFTCYLYRAVMFFEGLEYNMRQGMLCTGVPGSLSSDSPPLRMWNVCGAESDNTFRLRVVRLSCR